MDYFLYQRSELLGYFCKVRETVIMEFSIRFPSNSIGQSHGDIGRKILLQQHKTPLGSPLSTNPKPATSNVLYCVKVDEDFPGLSGKTMYSIDWVDRHVTLFIGRPGNLHIVTGDSWLLWIGHNFGEKRIVFFLVANGDICMCRVK